MNVDELNLELTAGATLLHYRIVSKLGAFDKFMKPQRETDDL